MTVIDWIGGDKFGLAFPAHTAALRAGGSEFLTRAFHTTNSLEKGNRVTRITQLDECSGGSTGRKVLLAVEYENASSSLPTELFVKFSRDFDDEVRDRGKGQLEPEVRLALLSRTPDFPIAVPTCFFADYHVESGTGILITARIPFGEGNIEPLYPKCLDYAIPEPLEHYRALIKAIARLAGAHKSGRLGDAIDREFAYDAEKSAADITIAYSSEQLTSRVQRLAGFAVKYPHLLPSNISSSAFMHQLTNDLPRFIKHQEAVKKFLGSQQKLIALIHWNANIDNGWFWRNEAGELECGLLDWGGVNQMNVGLALWSALSGAEIDIWDHHLDELLTLFAEEFHRNGGPPLAIGELKNHTLLYVAMMGISWLLDGPRRIESLEPNLQGAITRFDAPIRDNEHARTVLQMTVNFLNLWQTQNVGKILDQVVCNVAD